MASGKKGYKHLGVLLDIETFTKLQTVAANNHMSVSVFIREMLAEKLGSSLTPTERGFDEGYKAGIAHVREAFKVALDEFPTDKSGFGYSPFTDGEDY